MKTIIYICGDCDDPLIMKSALEEIDPSLKFLHFSNDGELFRYLRVAQEAPFIILCDVRGMRLSGIDLKIVLDADESLKASAGPFILLSDGISKNDVTKAYQFGVQGFFRKPSNFTSLKNQLRVILDYWSSAESFPSTH